MRHHISEKDSYNALTLIKEMKQLIGARNCTDIEEILKNTDYDSVILRPEGYKYLWESCVRSINLVFQTGNIKNTMIVLQRCSFFEGFSIEEKELLGQLRGVCEDIKKSKDKHEIALLSSAFYVRLAESENAIEVLKQFLLGSDCISSTEELEVRLELNSLVSFQVSYQELEICNILRIIQIDPTDEESFRLLTQKDCREQRIKQQIIQSLSQNIEKDGFWSAIFDEIFDYDIIIKIVEEIGLDHIKSIFAISGLVSVYNSSGRADKSIELLLEFCDPKSWGLDFHYLLADTYSSKRSYKEADKVIDKIMDFGKTDKALLYKGNVLRLQKHYILAINYYAQIEGKTCEGIQIDEMLFVCHAALKHNRIAQDYFASLCGYKISKAHFNKIYNWISNDLVPEYILSECLNNISADTGNPRIYWGEFDYFFSQIFSDTSEIENNGLLRVRLLKLHCYTRKVKEILQIIPSSDQFLFHYSGIQSLTKLANFQGNTASKFHLSNVAYMNDPTEGRLFLQILENGSEPEKIKRIIEKIYGNESISYRRTYLASFSLKGDFLPLWVQYAGNGTGCCYKIASTNFGIRDFSLEKQVLVNLRNLKKRNFQRPPVYRIHYYRQSDEKDALLTYFSSISDIILTLEPYIKFDRVKVTIYGMLDEIRYLVKSADYETEDEVRLVITDFEKAAKIKEGQSTNEAPRMYLELERTLQFKEIMLGPKVSNLKAWSAYLRNCDNVANVAKSTIQYE